MDTPYSKSFDELLNDLLTDYRNQVDADGNPVDTSKGSLAFIKAACIASALWGIYKHQDYIAAQIFPDTADSVNLAHHVSVRQLPLKEGESDADLLARLLDYIRRPPAGGNKYDFQKWALEVEGTKTALSIPLAQGLGSVDVVITADPVLTGSEIPTDELRALVKSHIDDQRRQTFPALRVLGPTVTNQDVTITVTGTVDRTRLVSEATSYLNGLAVAEKFFPARIVQIAVENGAETVTVDPAAPVDPGATGLIRAGAVNAP